MRLLLLSSGFDLSLRPMQYPQFYEMYKNSIKNTWTVDEVDWSGDLVDLKKKLKPGEQHLIKRLVAFFATGDNLVAENVVLSLYQNLNSPEARLFLSRQLSEEATHIDFYLTLLDTYIPDHDERREMFRALETIPSIKKKGEYARKVTTLGSGSNTKEQVLLNLILYACAIEGLFFYAAFAYVYFLRSKGLLNGLATGTNWVFRDESAHMNFALEAIEVIRDENPELFTANLEKQVRELFHEALECEYEFAKDVLSEGVTGLSVADIKKYLEYVIDQRLVMLGYGIEFGSKNPFSFLELQDAQELSNFFERRVSSYQTSVEGTVSFTEDF
jgi:ribonucleoside-diphosphate reductase beta chain